MALLRDEVRTARKHYPCDGYYWFDRSCYGQNDLEPDDGLVIEAVRADRGRILPGQKYMYQVSVDGDGFSVFRSRPEMHRICIKYDLYPDD